MQDHYSSYSGRKQVKSSSLINPWQKMRGTPMMFLIGSPKLLAFLPLPMLDSLWKTFPTMTMRKAQGEAEV